MLRPKFGRIWMILAWPVGHAKSEKFLKFNTKVLNFDKSRNLDLWMNWEEMIGDHRFGWLLGTHLILDFYWKSSIENLRFLTQKC